MDITDTTQSRFEAGIGLFLREGKCVTYQGVDFWKDGTKVLYVTSYSDWSAQNTTPEMAKEKIAQAKAVLVELSAKSHEFGMIARSLPHEYYFCYDYGKGGVALAKELNGEFTWLRGEPHIPA